MASRAYIASSGSADRWAQAKAGQGQVVVLSGEAGIGKSRLVQVLRACVVSRQVGQTPQLFPALWGLWMFYLVRATLATARELGEQLLHLAEQAHDPTLLLQAHMALGITLFHLGKFMLARLHLEQGLALYDPQQHHALAFLSGQDGEARRSA